MNNLLPVLNMQPYVKLKIGRRKRFEKLIGTHIAELSRKLQDVKESGLYFFS